MLPLGTRNGQKVEAYLRDPEDLRRARAVAATDTRQYGVAAAGRVQDQLRAEVLRLDTDGDPQGLRGLLDVTGDPDWWWPRRDIATPLTKAMERIHALGVPIPIEHLPAAIARVPRKRRAPVLGAWPPPLEGIHAWASAHPGWRTTDQGALEPVDARAVDHPHDLLITAVLAGRELSFTALHQGLVDAGMTSPAAGAALLFSPVLHRNDNGYVLIGTRTRRQQECRRDPRCLLPCSC